MSVSSWCKENGIKVSTYLSRQKKVYEAYTKKDRTQFIEVSVEPEISAPSVAVTINAGNIVASIHNGADENTITAVLRAMKNA